MATRVPTVLSNSAGVLDILSERSPMSVAEIAQTLELPRPSTYRIVESMQAVGLLTADDDGRYMLSSLFMVLGDAARTAVPEVVAARPAMRTLAETGLTVYVCTARAGSVRCLDWIPSRHLSLLQLTPGGTLPLHAGATSRAILAFDDELRASVLKQQEWTKFTSRTLQTAEAIDLDAAATRERGYSISDEDVTPGVAAIGVPVFDRRGHLRAALSVAGLRDDVMGQEMRSSELLLRAARSITSRLD
ncbi:IclR family transcriptional regulator [Saccharopolyspora tripterygii]